LQLEALQYLTAVLLSQPGSLPGPLLLSLERGKEGALLKCQVIAFV
jgi:hypothetical protein